MVSGDQWRDEEVAHTLRLLEIIGRTDIPVVPGAVFPLGAPAGRNPAMATALRQSGLTRAPGMNAGGMSPLSSRRCRKGNQLPSRSVKMLLISLVRKVHEFPHEVTIYEGGPMTNLALAISIDPHFADLAQGLVFMGGSVIRRPTILSLSIILVTSSISGSIPRRRKSSCGRRGRKSSVRRPTFRSRLA